VKCRFKLVEVDDQWDLYVFQCQHAETMIHKHTVKDWGVAQGGRVYIFRYDFWKN
jgi:hypothetical protein